MFVATATRIDKKHESYLYSRAALLLQQNIFRLHVAVNNFKFIESVQALKQRMSELADELQTEALKFVLFDQFVQIDVQQFKDDAHVIAEYKVIKPETS